MLIWPLNCRTILVWYMLMKKLELPTTSSSFASVTKYTKKKRTHPIAKTSPAVDRIGLERVGNGHFWHWQWSQPSSVLVWSAASQINVKHELQNLHVQPDSLNTKPPAWLSYLTLCWIRWWSFTQEHMMHHQSAELYLGCLLIWTPNSWNSSVFWKLYALSISANLVYSRSCWLASFICNALSRLISGQSMLAWILKHHFSLTPQTASASMHFFVYTR